MSRENGLDIRAHLTPYSNVMLTVETTKAKRRRRRRGPSPPVVCCICLVLCVAGAGLTYTIGSTGAFAVSIVAVLFTIVMFIVNERRGFASTKRKDGERRHYFNNTESIVLIAMIMLNAFVDALTLLR